MPPHVTFVSFVLSNAKDASASSREAKQIFISGLLGLRGVCDTAHGVK